VEQGNDAELKPSPVASTRLQNRYRCNVLQFRSVVLQPLLLLPLLSLAASVRLHAAASASTISFAVLVVLTCSER
jgi:hypothetical protein